MGAPVAMTGSADIPDAEKEKDMREIRNRVLGPDNNVLGLGLGLGESNWAGNYRYETETNPTLSHAVELTRSVLEPQRRDSSNAFNNVPASMEKAVLKLTNLIFSPELKQTIKDVNKFAVKLGDVGREAAAELSKMDVNDLKRHLFTGTVAVAASLAPSIASAADNPANLATRPDYVNPSAFLAIILGLSVPVVFLITLYIQSMAQGTATTFRQPLVNGGKAFKDED